MPKDRRSSSLDRCSRVSPYSRDDQENRKTRPGTPSLLVGNENEWEETRCPVCMEHPHNAVLLLCSSLNKRCRPFMCNRSYRHSNCLDQFHKSSMNADTSPQVNTGEETKLVCPLCRGHINGWKVFNPARQFMDSKVRSCSLGTCDYSGNYAQLRKHARYEHPNVRPTDIDPERKLEWRRLEEYLEQLDVLAIQLECVDNDYDNDDNVDAYASALNFIRSALDRLSSEFDARLPVSSRESQSEVTNSYNTGPRENGSTYSHNRLPERSRVHGPFDTTIRRPGAYGQTNTHNMLSERPRRYGLSNGHNRFLPRARGYGPNTRSHTHRRRGEIANKVLVMPIMRSNFQPLLNFMSLAQTGVSFLISTGLCAGSVRFNDTMQILFLRILWGFLLT